MSQLITRDGSSRLLPLKSNQCPFFLDSCLSGKSKLPLDKLSVEAAPTFNTTCSFWITRLRFIWILDGFPAPVHLMER